jgi:hypothetical protein
MAGNQTSLEHSLCEPAELVPEATLSVYGLPVIVPGETAQHLLDWSMNLDDQAPFALESKENQS